MIRGKLTYRARVALPPDSIVVIELGDVGALQWPAAWEVALLEVRRCAS